MALDAFRNTFAGNPLDRASDKRADTAWLADQLASPDALQPEWEINPASLALGAVIGAGEFGVVHAARWWGQPVAVKVLRRSTGTDAAGAAAGPGTTTNAAAAIALGDLRSELAVLQRVHHPQTVQFLGAVTSSRPYMIVSELVSGGSVGDLLVDIRAGRAPPLPARLLVLGPPLIHSPPVVPPRR